MHRKNHVNEYLRIQSEGGLEPVHIHKGWGRVVGDMYRPVGERSIQEYYDDLITHMNTRVLLSPEYAIGGDWDTAGELQLNIMRSVGMGASDSLLDFGCGTLRAGKHFIPFLEQRKYTGIDISPEAIDSARQLVTERQLEDKEPRLILNDRPADEEMFPGMEGKTFDYIVCLWVCYDMPEKVFRRFLHQAIDHMHSDSVMVFSWVKRDHTHPPDDKLFSWMHDYRIVEEVVEERGVVYMEFPFNLHKDDEQIVACLELE